MHFHPHQQPTLVPQHQTQQVIIKTFTQQASTSTSQQLSSPNMSQAYHTPTNNNIYNYNNTNNNNINHPTEMMPPSEPTRSSPSPQSSIIQLQQTSTSQSNQRPIAKSFKSPPPSDFFVNIAANLSYASIAQYFRLPLHEACVFLHVDETSLKKRCRELGIRRWPYRKRGINVPKSNGNEQPPVEQLPVVEEFQDNTESLFSCFQLSKKGKQNSNTNNISILPKPPVQQTNNDETVAVEALGAMLGQSPSVIPSSANSHPITTPSQPVVPISPRPVHQQPQSSTNMPSPKPASSSQQPQVVYKQPNSSVPPQPTTYMYAQPPVVDPSHQPTQQVMYQQTRPVQQTYAYPPPPNQQPGQSQIVQVVSTPATTAPNHSNTPQQHYQPPIPQQSQSQQVSESVVSQPPNIPPPPYSGYQSPYHSYPPPGYYPPYHAYPPHHENVVYHSYPSQYPPQYAQQPQQQNENKETSNQQRTTSQPPQVTVSSQPYVPPGYYYDPYRPPHHYTYPSSNPPSGSTSQAVYAGYPTPGYSTIPSTGYIQHSQPQRDVQPYPNYPPHYNGYPQYLPQVPPSYVQATKPSNTPVLISSGTEPTNGIQPCRVVQSVNNMGTNGAQSSGGSSNGDLVSPTKTQRMVYQRHSKVIHPVIEQVEEPFKREREEELLDKNKKTKIYTTH